MDASVFWDGLYALRDLWKHDKAGLAWGTGLALLMFWGTLLWTGKAGILGMAATGLGVAGAALFCVGLAVWIVRTPQRRARAQRPDR